MFSVIPRVINWISCRVRQPAWVAGERESTLDLHFTHLNVQNHCGGVEFLFFTCGPSMSDSSLTNAELDLLKRFGIQNREADPSTANARWAARCQALIAELEQLQRRAAHLSEVAEGTVHQKLSDTAII
jgi:hypothetical protein